MECTALTTVLLTMIVGSVNGKLAGPMFCAQNLLTAEFGEVHGSDEAGRCTGPAVSSRRSFSEDVK